MYNIKRPSTKETDKELVELDALLRKQLTKSQEAANEKKDDENDSNPELCKRKLAFTGSGKTKKKKENIVDYSVLEEAVSDTKKKSAVLGKIVVRDVTGAAEFVNNWKPSSYKEGFPAAPMLTLLDNPTTSKQSHGKSLFMQHLEKEGKLKKEAVAMRDVEESSFPRILVQENSDEMKDNSTDQIGLLSDQSEEIVTQDRKMLQRELSLLTSLSEEEICEERNSLLRKMKPDTIQFIKSLKEKKIKPLVEEMHTEISAEDVEHMDVNSLPTTSVREDEKLSLSQLSLPFEELEPLMECGIEYKKLKWMSEVSKPISLKHSLGFTARFNLEGDVLPYDTKISTKEGLHHHGDEPGRAGYTFDELFIFVRSNVVQQRHFGLRMLANILRNAKEGLYDECLDRPVIPLMINSGLVSLLRFAIDESTALVYQEGIRALYYLVCNEPDEHCLDLVSSWSPHSTVPGVSSENYSKKKDREELDKEEKEMKDDEILQLDVIRALLRMDVHLRLRYILAKVKPSPPVVIHILGILGRMARHSLDVAWTLAQCRDLLSNIVENFMPHNLGSLLTGSNSLNVKCVYGFPLRHAVVFMKVMCDRGKQLAALVCELPNIMQSLLSYVSLEPTNVEMPLVEVMHLAVEAYSLWSTLLSYGLKKPQEAFISFYPMILKQLLFYRDNIDVDCGDSNNFNYDIGTKLADVLTKALHIASRYSLMNDSQKNSKPLVTGADGKPEVLAPPLLKWQLFKDIFELVEICLLKWFTQMSRASGSFRLLRMVGSFVNFVTVYMDNWRYQDDFEGTAFSLESSKAFQIIKPFLMSNNFSTLLKRTKKYSILCSDLENSEQSMYFRRDPLNLSSLGSVTYSGEVLPLLQPGSPFPLLLPITSFMVVLLTKTPSVDDSMLDNLLDNEIIIDYVTTVNNTRSKIANNWFTRVEIFILCNFLQLAVLKGKSSQLLHETAINLLTLVHEGDEHLIKDMVIKVICNKSFATDFLSIESQIESMHLDNVVGLPSPATTKIISSPLSKISVESLHSTGNIIVASLLRGNEIDNSFAKKSGMFFLINSLTQDFSDTSHSLDGYWVLQNLRKLALSDNDGKQDLPTLQKIPSIRKILSMTYLLLKHRKHCVYRHTNVTGWFRYLSLVFTSANDIFLDPEVSQLLQACLMEILKDGGSSEIQPTVSVPGMSFCLDWYRNFLEQFSGVSYYDSTFALFVIIPLQMSWPETYRMLLWDDFMPALRFISLSCSQVDQFVPVKQFLEPLDSNEKVINCYHRAIQGGFINPKKTPFLYYVAYYHIKNQQTISINNRRNESINE